uniref:Uncharacterized protein n=1 Tax=Arundo donax TaxID=35708 RepID=A0A0A9H7F0_ARUDO
MPRTTPTDLQCADCLLSPSPTSTPLDDETHRQRNRDPTPAQLRSKRQAQHAGSERNHSRSPLDRSVGRDRG